MEDNLVRRYIGLYLKANTFMTREFEIWNNEIQIFGMGESISNVIKMGCILMFWAQWEVESDRSRRLTPILYSVTP